MTPIVLLGPQRFEPTVASALESLGAGDRVAAVTAGWQERESEADELREHIGRELINLQIYERHEKVLERDPQLAEALRERQGELQELQQLYRMRLSYLLEAARELMSPSPGNRFQDEHRRAAIRAVRTLDRQHLTQLRKIHRDFEARWKPSERPAVVAERREIARVLDRTGAVVIAGGHVAVLLTRMRLFELPELLDRCKVVAWSAGAMALTERVVLFHDRPPQGRGNPEVFDAGLAMCRNVVALPHARRRLRLDDPVRVSLFAQRFSPAQSVVLDRGAILTCGGKRPRGGRGTLRLGRQGKLSEVG